MVTLAQPPNQTPHAALQRKRLLTSLNFGLVYVFWGSTYLAILIGVRHLPPALLCGVRFPVSGAIMLAWCVMTGKTIRLSGRDALKLLLVGVLLMTTGNAVLAWSEQYIHSGLAAMIVAIVPIWVALIETVIGGDRLRGLGWTGLLLGFAGLFALLWPDLTSGTTLGRRDLIVSLIVALAALSWAAGSVCSHHFHVDVGLFAATGWEMLFAGIVNMLFAAAHGDFQRADWSRSAWLAIAYLVVFGSLVGFTAYSWLLDHVPTPKVATYAYVNPVVAVFLGWIFLGEHLDRYMFLGMIVIIAAVALVTSSKLRSGSSPAAACETGAD